MGEMLNDEFLDRIAKIAAQEDAEDHERVPGKVEAIDLCCDYLQRTVTGAKVTSVIGAPYKSMGYISLVGKDIKFDSSETFLAVASIASNVEVYPMTDGNVRINFTFHGIARRK